MLTSVILYSLSKFARHQASSTIGKSLPAIEQVLISLSIAYSGLPSETVLL